MGSFQTILCRDKNNIGNPLFSFERKTGIYLAVELERNVLNCVSARVLMTPKW